MKKVAILSLVLALTFGAQAQFGNLGNAIKKGVEKKVEQKAKQKVEQEVDKALDEAFGLRKQDNEKTITERQQVSRETEEPSNDGIPTPEQVMATVPPMPTYQNIADYLCEQSHDDPSMLKLLANPTTAFITKMATAAASGYISMFGSSGSGHILYYDEVLLRELGVTDEAYEAMTEAEKEALASKYSAEIQDRYLRTAEMLGNDEGYGKLQNQYGEIESEIEKLYTEAEETCRDLWTKKYAEKGDKCGYYRDAVPVYYKAINDAMKIRKSRQLALAKDIDKYVQKLADKHRGEVYAGFYNQAGLCATSYVADAARLLSISDPQ